MMLYSEFCSRPTRILDSRVLSKYEEQWAKPQYIWLLCQRGLASGFGKGITDYQEDFPDPVSRGMSEVFTLLLLLLFCIC